MTTSQTDGYRKTLVLYALYEAKDALEDQKNLTPLKLFLRGWVHFKKCECKVCEALFVIENAINEINKSIVNKGADTEPEGK